MQPYAKKAALGSAIALSAGTSYLALNQRRPILMDEYLKREKLSIYPRSQPEIVLVETYSPLQSHIAVGREAATGVFQSVRDETQKVVSKWINVERKLSAHVKRILPEDESLMPGIAWVGVSTLAGSLVTRNRTFLLRLIAPPAFFLISLPYFLPKLSVNLSNEISSLTAARAPEFHRSATAFKHDLDDTLERTEDWYFDTKRDLASGVGKTVSLVEKKTGLQLYQAFESSFAKKQSGAHPHAHHAHAAQEDVKISTSPAGQATVPLFEQKAVSSTVVPGTPVPAPSTTTSAVPVQTLEVPVYRQLSGPQTTSEKVDATAAAGLAKIEDKVSEGLASVRQSDVVLAAAHKVDDAKQGIDDLKHRAEDALRTTTAKAEGAVKEVPGQAAELKDQAQASLKAGERKVDEAVGATQAHLASAADKTRAEVAHLQKEGSTLAHQAEGKASELALKVEGKAADVSDSVRAQTSNVVDKVEREAKDLKTSAVETLRAGEAKSREVLADAQAKANAAASAVKDGAAAAEQKVQDGLASVKQTAKETKASLDANDKVLKVDEQTVDGKKQAQPKVVGLLAGQPRESGYKKLV